MRDHPPATFSMLHTLLELIFSVGLVLVAFFSQQQLAYLHPHPREGLVLVIDVECFEENDPHMLLKNATASIKF